MKLSRLRVQCPGTLGDLRFDLCDGAGNPRALTVVYGDAGAGKTTLLKALNSTRPGHVVTIGLRPGEPPCFACAEWSLGIDEPDRQHCLVLTSPNAPAEFLEGVAGVPDALVRRREAALFDRVALGGGFAFLSVSALRWFSRSPLAFHAPARSVARYDVRASEPLDDAGRNDLTRDVKQALAYAAITAALSGTGAQAAGRHQQLGALMYRSVSELIGLYGYAYRGLNQVTLEPEFEAPKKSLLTFDALPGPLKHAVAIPALVLRLLWAAYPNLSPIRAPAVVAIDQFELHQDESVLSAMVEALLRLFPEVQWLLTTRSTSFLSVNDAAQIIALRRGGMEAPVDVHTGVAARVH